MLKKLVTAVIRIVDYPLVLIMKIDGRIVAYINSKFTPKE